MLKEFSPLSPSEQQQLFDAIPLIVILVAGADGDMDEVELADAQKLADIRSYDNKGRLQAYYEAIDDNLVGRIQQLSKELPYDVETRQQEIGKRLGMLNDVFPKMEEPFGYLYYQSFHSFSRHVAESHGGFLRFMTVGPKEAKVVNLPMIKQMAKPDETDFPDLPSVVLH